MKTFSSDALDALEAGTAIVSGAIAIMTTDPFLGWGGYGSKLLGDGRTYSGLGDRLLCSAIGGQLGGGETGATVSLSGVDPDVLAGIDLVAARGVDAVIRRLIFDGSGTQLLQDSVFLRGRVDQLYIDETVGGTSTIAAEIVGAARGLGRRSGRMRSDADMRLRSVTDGGMSRIAYAGEKTLYWGGKPPQMAQYALPGAGGFGAGFANIVRSIQR